MRFVILCLITIPTLLSGCVDKYSNMLDIGNFSFENLGNLSFENLSNLGLDNMEKLLKKVPKPEIPSKEIVLKVGESAEVDGINVTVEKVWITKNLQKFDTFRPLDRHSGTTEEGEFVVAQVKIVNNGNETLYLTGHDFIISDKDGNVYSYSVLTHLFNDALELEELKKGKKVEGKIVFAVPENVTGLKIAYCFGSLADFRAVFNFFKTRWAIWKLDEGVMRI